MAYWALEALDGSKTALSSLDRVEGTDPPAYKLGRRPHEESHFGTLPICVSRNQAQLSRRAMTGWRFGTLWLGAYRRAQAPRGVRQQRGCWAMGLADAPGDGLDSDPPPRAPPPHPSRLASQP